MLALAAWGLTALKEPRSDQVITPESMTIDLRSAFRSSVALELPPTTYAARLATDELLIRVHGPRLEVSRGGGPADLSFAAGHGIHRLIAGELDAPRAIASGAVEVLDGHHELLDRFARTFRLAA